MNYRYNYNQKFEQQNSIEEEGMIRESSLINLPPSIIRVSKSICKIVTPFAEATGFLIKFRTGEEDFYCLMTNEHVIERELVEQKKKITFYYDGESECNKIYLNSNERFIKHFRKKGIDATIVEILPEDNISKDYFLLPIMDYMFNYKNLLKQVITIVQYPKGNSSYASGKIINIIIIQNVNSHIQEKKKE